MVWDQIMCLSSFAEMKGRIVIVSLQPWKLCMTWMQCLSLWEVLRVMCKFNPCGCTCEHHLPMVLVAMKKQSNFWWATPDFHYWVKIVTQNSIDHGHWVPWLLHILLENWHPWIWHLCFTRDPLGQHLRRWCQMVFGSFPCQEAGMSSKCHATKTLASWRPLLCQADIAKLTKWKCHISPLGSSQSQNVISIQSNSLFAVLFLSVF